MSSKRKKTILVAGASSGIGLSVAEQLSRQGYTVYAGARSFRTEEVNPREEGKPGAAGKPGGALKPGVALKPEGVGEPGGVGNTSGVKLIKIHLDVTDQSSVDDVVSYIMKNEGKIDVLINCAVYLVRGSVEDTTIEEFQGVIDTALIGTLRMCKAVIPIMRTQGDGMIINLSSVNGLMAIPFVSSYTAAKFAIEGLSETLSMEVKDFGIKVVLIEPGDHRNGSEKTRKSAKNANLKTSPYYSRFINAVNRVIKDEAEGSDPDELAKMICKIIENPRPKLRYKKIASFEHMAFFMKAILPDRVFEKLISDYYYEDKIMGIPRYIIDNPLAIFKKGGIKKDISGN